MQPVSTFFKEENDFLYKKGEKEAAIAIARELKRKA